MSTQIARIGNTIAVAIPEELLQKANLSVGDSVEWALTPSGALALRGSGEGADDYEAWKLEEVQAGLAELDAAESVPHEKVAEWLKSWGTRDELPPPQ